MFKISECCVKEIITKVKLGSDEESNKNHMFVCLFVLVLMPYQHNPKVSCVISQN